MEPSSHAVAPSPQAGRYYVYLISLVAAVGGFLFGFDLCIIAGAQIYFKSYFNLDADAYGFAVGSAMLGCMVGPFLGAWICDAVGRKKTLIIAAVLFGVSALGTALPQTIFQFNIFRILGGIGVGLASVASPMYIAEIAPARIRGRLVTMNQLAITIGALSSIIIAYFLAKYIDEDTSWRWMFASEMPPIIAFVVFLLLLPETPRWLVSRNRPDEALAVLDRINGCAQAQIELENVEASLVEETGSWRELFQPGIRRALAAGMFVALMAMWTGWSVISFYLPTIFQKANASETTDAIFQSILAYSANLVFTFVCLYIMDRLGRRTMWLGGSLAMVVGTFLLGLVFFTNTTGWRVLLVVLLCDAPHAIVLGPLCWLIISEIFPTRIRARAASLCTLVVWTAGWVSTWATPRMFEFFEGRFGSPAGLFWIFSGVSLLSFLIALRLLPETKGRSLEDIAAFWLSRGKNPQALSLESENVGAERESTRSKAD